MSTDRIDGGGEGRFAGAWRRGMAGLAILIAALLLVGVVIQLAQSNRERDAALTRERQSYDMLIVIRGIDASMARAEAALGRFVISGDRQTGTLYYHEWRRAGQLLQRLAVLGADDRVQARLLRELTALYEKRGEELAQPAMRATYRQGWQALSMFNQAGNSQTIPGIARLLEEVAARERMRLSELSRAAQQAIDWSNSLAHLLSVLGVALMGGAIMLCWLAYRAAAQQRASDQRADEEADRAETLEAAVAERTRELSLANEQLIAEATERAAAEAQLRQVQKMEAVGQLTGGIAHDFNNMLAVVVGGLDLARRRLDQGPDEVGRHIENAMEGANRAAALTKRLLAFARAEPLLPESFDPAALIVGMSDLMDRTLGERMRVEVRGPAEAWPVWCDPHGLENAILNLAVNARDAMDGEGLLIVATENVVLNDREVGEAPAGDYVRVSVTDHGGGIAPEILERVFEPFFTTKPVGKGTGLGLSQIFGFAQQSGGEVAIESEVGKGTTVSLYLPRFSAAPDAVDSRPVMPIGHSVGQEELGATMLVVEDDPRVRNATVEALEELGYCPLPCAGGDEALQLLAARRDIRLVVTDVVMPGMTGPQLAERVHALYPRIGLLFVSGYVGEAGDAEQFRGHELLRKPFTVTALAAAVRTALADSQRQQDQAA